MEKTGPRRRKWSDWVELTAQWEASGLSLEQFAATRGLNEGTFKWRVWQVRKERRAASAIQKAGPRFVEVTQTGADSHADGGCRITVTRTEVEFSTSQDPRWLASFITQLSRPS